MFNINGFEFLIIGIIAVLVIGPKRLPEYTQKFRNFVREARRMASG
ncbi:MAG: twin-arginine translocase TatA/TatE family subunit, partial [Renibacterium salmoninarum]|nr:twin-arginine translocase TatA/TatE family subunit [Renibacterium salmoninarum]